ARAIAHDVLVRVETTEAFADVLLADRLAGARLGPSDHALATRLVYGTLAWQGRLDHELGALVRTPLARLDPPVLAALRLGLFQLRFLDRVPAYAAVDASVGLARAAGRGATGLVNAVLRRAASDGAPSLAGIADPLERVAIECSHPRWLVERWAAEMGASELPELLAANNVRGRTALRTNRLRANQHALIRELEAADVAVRPSEWTADGIVVERGAGRLRALEAWNDGRFAFQGEASQLVTTLLGAAPGTRVFDACAAPGGKAVQTAAAIGARGVVAALDRRPGGATRIRGEAARLGARAVHVIVGDARRPPVRPGFDAVLVDGPCSGLGTLRRHPELRWRRRPDDVPRLAQLQREILDGVAPLVRPGGVLVYVVCTLTREENEDVVEAFRAAHPRFAVEHASALSVPAEVVTPAGYVRTLPHRHGLDGFFAARLRLDSRPGVG